VLPTQNKLTIPALWFAHSQHVGH